MEIQVEEYVREDGSNPYQQWFLSLDVTAAAKVAVAKVRLELGHTSNIAWFRGIGEYKDRKKALAAERKGKKP